MKRLLPLIIIVCTAIFFNTVRAVPAQEAGLLRGVSENAPVKTVLKNGLTVIIKKTPPSGLVSIIAGVRAGSAYQGRFSGSGIAHFVEHMIFKGTAKRRPGEIEREIRSLGGTIGGATTFDYTSYSITIPKEHLSYALDALSDSLFNANIDSREFERERGVILKEIRLTKDDPIRYISRLLWGQAFKTHPYRDPIIGYESLLLKLKREDLAGYHKEMYLPNNMILAIVGDIEYEKTLNIVKEYFDKTGRGIFELQALPQERTQASKRVLDITGKFQMAYFALGYPTVDAVHPDMPALDVLSAILGQGGNSRLNSALYRKKELVYSIGAWNYTPLDPGLLVISGAAESKKLNATLNAIDEELRNIKKGSVGEDELERVKAMVRAGYIYSLETASDQARDLVSSSILAGDYDFTKSYLKKIDLVTVEDVKKVAGHYLNEDSLSLVTFSSSRPAQAAKDTETGSEKEIEKFVLPNGLKCLLMENHSLPTVSMMAASLGGLRAETEKTAGISNLTALMMLKGTESMPEEEILGLVERMGANLSYFSGNNTFGIRLKVLSKDTMSGLELFRDIILSPSFPKTVLRRERNSVLGAIKATEDNIFNLGIKGFRETLFKEHPYRFQTIGTIDSVNKLRRTGIEDFYHKYFVPNNMVLAVFGDIDSRKIKDWITENFQEAEQGPSPKFNTAREPEQTDIRRLTVPTEKKQSLVIMGFKGATIEGKDRYALQLITTCLSGISGRLAKRLREELGIAYAVGAFSVPGSDPGYFAFYAATTNDKIDQVKKEFTRQIGLLNKKGLTDEEIKSAKSELIGNQLIALQTNASMAYQTVLDELYGLGYDNYKKFRETIDSVTNKDIVGASKRYLKPRAFTVVTIEGLRPKKQ